VQIMTILMILESYLSGNNGLFCCLYMSCPPVVVVAVVASVCLCGGFCFPPFYAGMKASFCCILAIPCCGCCC
jgi:hypothetical protein